MIPSPDSPGVFKVCDPGFEISDAAMVKLEQVSAPPWPS